MENLELLKLVLPFVEGAYECAFPDEDHNAYVAEEIRRKIEKLEKVESGVAADPLSIANAELAEIKKALFFSFGTRHNLLTGAIEGGSNYWYWLGEDACKIMRKYKAKHEPLVAYFFRALQEGESIPVRQDDDEGDILGYISMGSIEKAEVLMATKYSHHYADVLLGNDDATTADVWFQLAVMGEIVYG